MTINLDDIEENLLDKIELGLSEQAIRAAQSTVQLSQLPAEESSRIQRAKNGELAIEATARPKFHGRLDPLKVTTVPLEAVERIAAIADASGLTASADKDTDSIFDLAAAPKESSLEKDDALLAAQKGLANGISQLKSDEELLRHGLAAPYSDESSLDSLRRSDELLSNSSQTAIKAAAPFPNLAREIMQLGLAMEKFHTEHKLSVYKQQGDVCKAKIDLLLKLSAQLPRMNEENGSYELNVDAKQEIIKIANELKALEIDIFPGREEGGEFTKEQLASASSLINHHIDVNRTHLQELFTTKISVSIQFLQMMTEVMKKVSDLDDRQKRKALELR